jgi:hypothetical protein
MDGTSGGGSIESVPEPAGALLIVMAGACCFLAQRSPLAV